MESLGWRQRRGSSPAARRGARQRAGLTAASASNSLSCERETLHQNPIKNTLTVITVSTATGDRSKGRWPDDRPHVDRGEDRLAPDQRAAVPKICRPFPCRRLHSPAQQRPVRDLFLLPRAHRGPDPHSARAGGRGRREDWPLHQGDPKPDGLDDAIDVVGQHH